MYKIIFWAMSAVSSVTAQRCRSARYSRGYRICHFRRVAAVATTTVMMRRCRMRSIDGWPNQASGQRRASLLSIPDQSPSNSSWASAAAGKRPSIALSCLGCGAGRVGQFVDHARCAGGVADEQRNVAIVGKLAHGVDQCIGAGVVETIGDLHPVRVE